MIQTICTCGERYQVRDDLAGRTMRCLGCGGLVNVPGRPSSGERRAAGALEARPSGVAAKKVGRSDRAVALGHAPEARALLAGALAGFGAIALICALLAPRIAHAEKATRPAKKAVAAIVSP
jgi:hypothetical protein